MRSTTDRGSTGGSERASSLAIRRFGDTYQFELDLPSAGGGLRPTIWSGSRSIDPEVWALLSGALETATAGFESTDFPTMAGTATMVVPSTVGHLEQLGKLIFRYVLPEEVQ